MKIPIGLPLFFSIALTTLSALTLDPQAPPTILIPANATHPVLFSAREIQAHFKLHWGIDLPVKETSEGIHGPIFAIGATPYSIKNGIAKSYREQEFQVLIQKEAILLNGNDGKLPPFSATNEPLPTATMWESQGKVSPSEPLKFIDGSNASDKAIELSTKDNLKLSGIQYPDEEGGIDFLINFETTEKIPEGKSATIFRIDGKEPVWTYQLIELHADGRLEFRTYDGKMTRGIATVNPLKPGWNQVSIRYSAALKAMSIGLNGTMEASGGYEASSCKGETIHWKGPLKISEFRLLGNYSKEAARLPVPFTCQEGTLLISHFEPLANFPHRTSMSVLNGGKLAALLPPDSFTEQGTLYATYDFLENACGFHWYAPRLSGMHFPKEKKIVLKELRRLKQPSFLYREIYPAAPPFVDEPGVPYSNYTLWEKPNSIEMRLYWARQRMGGEPFYANHSFLGWKDRFLKKNPKLESIFEESHPEYFAQGYKDSPEQLNYTHPATRAQAAKDAIEYFDGKGLRYLSYARGEYFPLVPFDNVLQCTSPESQSKIDHSEDPLDYFSKGRSSRLIFEFANAVAKEVSKKHPDKWISTLAYMDYALYPEGMKMESNMAVELCMAGSRLWYSPNEKARDLKQYEGWIKNRAKDTRFFVWLYSIFPEYMSHLGRFNAFPGFYAKTHIEQIKRFHQDGVRGIFVQGTTGPVEVWLQFQLMLDPTQNTDELLDRYFTDFYGTASKSVRSFYNLVEKVYSTPDAYPPELLKNTASAHQTEEIAWEYLGTPKVMEALGKYVEEAKKSVKGELATKRLNLFLDAYWTPMQAGAAQWKKNGREMIQLKKLPPLVFQIPHANASAAGDFSKIDWRKASEMKGWRRVTGQPTERNLSGKMLHDGEFLYLQFQEVGAALNLKSHEQIYHGDDWELFIAGQRALPMTQALIGPKGTTQFIPYGNLPIAGWAKSLQMKSESSDPTKWSVTLALPIKELPQAANLKGEKCIYLNLYRGSPGFENTAWQPNFTPSFQNTDRMAECVFLGK